MTQSIHAVVHTSLCVYAPSTPPVKRWRPPEKASALIGRVCPPWRRVRISPVPVASSKTDVPLAQATVSPAALNAGRARCRLPVTATLLKPTASNAAADADAGDDTCVVVAVAVVALADGDDDGRLRRPEPAPVPAALPTPGVVGGGEDDGGLLEAAKGTTLAAEAAAAAAAPSEASEGPPPPPAPRVDAGGIGWERRFQEEIPLYLVG